MADIELLKRLAEACDIERCADEEERDRNLNEFYSVLEPEDVAALIAENERLRQIISDSATACGAAMSAECTVEFMGHLPAEIAGVLGQLCAELERARKDAEALEVAIKDLLFAMQVDPSCQLGVVERCRCFFCASSRAKSAMGKGGGQNGSKAAETRANAGLEGGGHGANRAGGHSAENQAETRVNPGSELAGKGGRADG